MIHFFLDFFNYKSKPMKIYISILPLMCVLTCVNSAVTCGDGEFYVKRSRRRRSVRSICRPCIAGYWQSESGHNHKSCQLCPPGKYSSWPGSNECTGGPICAPGTVGIIGAVSENESSCKDCVPGRYSNIYGAGPECHSCPSGQYTNQSKTTSCMGGGACPAGKYGSMFNTNQGLCNNCPIGKITVKPGLFVCSACPSGQYQLKMGQPTCILQDKCGRWKIHRENANECIYLYNIDLYIALVVLAWVSTLLALKVLWISMEPCLSWSTAMVLITFGVSIWLSTYHPINIDHELSNVKFGCLAAFVIITICVCINYILVDTCGNNYISSCNNKDVPKHPIDIQVDGVDKAYV